MIFSLYFINIYTLWIIFSLFYQYEFNEINISIILTFVFLHFNELQLIFFKNISKRY